MMVRRDQYPNQQTRPIGITTTPGSSLVALAPRDGGSCTGQAMPDRRRCRRDAEYRPYTQSSFLQTADLLPTMT